jgi:hypothetical protein
MSTLARHQHRLIDLDTDRTGHLHRTRDRHILDKGRHKILLGSALPLEPTSLFQLFHFCVALLYFLTVTQLTLVWSRRVEPEPEVVRQSMNQLPPVPRRRFLGALQELKKWSRLLVFLPSFSLV